MLTKLDRYECEGQLSIFDYLKAADSEPEKPRAICEIQGQGIL